MVEGVGSRYLQVVLVVLLEILLVDLLLVMVGKGV
jgi:hypothetical protein